MSCTLCGGADHEREACPWGKANRFYHPARKRINLEITMNLTQITAIAYNTSMAAKISQTGTAPQPKLFEQLADTDAEKPDAIARAASVLNSAITLPELMDWSQDQFSHVGSALESATFQAACIGLRSKWDGTDA